MRKCRGNIPVVTMVIEKSDQPHHAHQTDGIEIAAKWQSRNVNTVVGVTQD